jgi:hypothetical protein
LHDLLNVQDYTAARVHCGLPIADRPIHSAIAEWAIAHSDWGIGEITQSAIRECGNHPIRDRPMNRQSAIGIQRWARLTTTVSPSPSRPP